MKTEGPSLKSSLFPHTKKREKIQFDSMFSLELLFWLLLNFAHLRYGSDLKAANLEPTAVQI